MELQRNWSEGMDWTNSVCFKLRWRAVVNKDMNFRVLEKSLTN
jgi:hypothetical protein